MCIYNGYVFIGDSTPTIPSLASSLTVGGNTTNAIVIGNVNNYSARTIKFQDATGTSAGIHAKVEGADASGTNQMGGNLLIEAGAGTNTTRGGHTYIRGGGNSGSSGVGGDLFLQTADASNSHITAITVAGTTQAISIAKDTSFDANVDLAMNSS